MEIILKQDMLKQYMFCVISLRIIWGSSFVNLLKLNSTEKFYVPDAAVVYKKPPALLGMFTNYRNIAHNESFQCDVNSNGHSGAVHQRCN